MSELTTSELMRQAGGTVQVYLSDAVDMIDMEFGEGYAKKHPELVAQFLTACSIDCVGMVLAQRLDRLKDELYQTGGDIANISETLHTIS